MVISKIMLKDFKSYKDTVEIKFGGRFNVIIGENINVVYAKRSCKKHSSISRIRSALASMP